VDVRERHLRLLTETIEAVNSTLDLEEVLALVARKVADALGADACFVYLYDERTDELVLRATHGTSVEEMTRRPRMHPGEGITGVAAAERAPVMIPAQAHLDPRFKTFANLPEDEYESILAVPILARERLAGALNIRTRRPREFTQDEIDLLVAIAAQVAQTIVHAQLYAQAQRRVAELEALARISEAVSESLYLEESLEAIVVQGLTAGKDVRAKLEPVSLAGSRATALALVFSELLQNALEHGGNEVQIELARRDGEVLLAIADDGVGIDDEAAGTGLSIVRALVRDELQGRLELRNDRGTRAEVVFPA
jgi:two-component sensor histidine kinase